MDRIDVLPRQVRWDAMARAALRDELLEAQDGLTAAVLRNAEPGIGPDGKPRQGRLVVIGEKGFDRAAIRTLLAG